MAALQSGNTVTNHTRSSSLGRSKSLRLPSTRKVEVAPSSPSTLTRHGSIRLPKSHSLTSDVLKPLVKKPPPLKPKPVIDKFGEKVNTLPRALSSKNLAPPDDKPTGIYRTLSPKLDRNHLGYGRTAEDSEVPCSAIDKESGLSRSSSASLSRDMGFSLEVVRHWKRLTEEHDKLQMEYARLRLQHLDNTASKLLSAPFVRKEPSHMHAAYSDTHLDTIPEDVPSSLPRSCFVDDKKQQHVEEYIQQLESLVQGYRLEVLRSQEEHRRMQRKYWEQVVSLDSCGAKEEASKQVFELLDKLDEKQKESIQATNKVQELKTQLASVTEELDKCHNALQDYQYQIENGEHQRGQMERKLKDAVTDLSETKESVEFLQAERTTLAESLQEAEQNLASTKALLEKERSLMHDLSNRYRKLYSKVQDKNLQLQVLQSELESTQGRARDMLLSQGSELTLGAINLSKLTHRISSVLMSYIDYATTTLGLEQEVINEALSRADSIGEDESKTPNSESTKPTNGTFSSEDSSPTDTDDGHKVKSTSIVQAIIQALEEQSKSDQPKSRSNPHSPCKKNPSEISEENGKSTTLCNGRATEDGVSDVTSASKPVGMATAFRPPPKAQSEKHPLAYVNGDLSPDDCKTSIENQVKQANRMVNQLLTLITLMQKKFSSQVTALENNMYV